MKQPTTLRTHLLSMLSAGIAHENQASVNAQAHQAKILHAQRSAHLRAALYRISNHKFSATT